MSDEVMAPKDTTATPQDPVAAAIVAGFFLLMIGLFIALVSFIPSNIDAKLIKNGNTVEGTVINVEEHSSRGANQEVSTIAYTVDGEEYLLEEKHAISKWNFTPTEADTKVTVHYNADKPKKAVAKGWEKSGLTGYVAGGAAGVFAVFIVVATIISPNQDKKKTK